MNPVTLDFNVSGLVIICFNNVCLLAYIRTPLCECNFLFIEVLLDRALSVILDGTGEHFRHSFHGTVPFGRTNERSCVE